MSNCEQELCQKDAHGAARVVVASTQSRGCCAVCSPAPRSDAGHAAARAPSRAACSGRGGRCTWRLQTSFQKALTVPVNHPRQRPENRGPRLCHIEARFPVSAHARGHNLEFRAPVQRRHIQGVGTTSSGGALRKTDVPRRSCSTSSSYSSSSSSMLMAWRSPIDQRATIRMMLNPTYQSPF